MSIEMPPAPTGDPIVIDSKGTALYINPKWLPWLAKLVDAIRSLADMGALVVSYPVRAVASTGALDADTDAILIVNAGTGAVALTSPLGVTRGTGRPYWIKKIDDTDNAVTFQPQGGELIDGESNLSLTVKNERAIIVWDGTGWQRLS